MASILSHLKRFFRSGAVPAPLAKYDGASRGRRGQLRRRTPGTSADAELERDLKVLRNVSRDFDRNNPYATRILSVLATDVVGAGIVPSFSEGSETERRRLKEMVAQHCDTPAIDFDGRNTLAGLQYLAMRAMVRDGEVLALRIVNPRPDAIIPLQIRLLEADYLDTNVDGSMPSGNFASHGVEFDASGRRVAYHLYEQHPGAISGQNWKPLASRRVRAEDVIHLYRVDRPGQSRGAPWLAPAIPTLWDLHDYETNELLKQQAAAAFAIFVVNPNGGPNTLGGAVAGTTERGTDVERIESGTIQDLGPGEDIRFPTTPVVPGYADYVRMAQRRIATAVGVPFNVVASDDSQENFASSRRGHIVYQRTIDVYRWQLFIPQFCDPLMRWVIEAAQLRMARPIRSKVNHTPPRRDLISPKEEVPVMRDMIRSGLMSRADTIRSLGYDPAEVDAEIAADNARADKLELSFDSDGRRPLNGPLPQQDNANAQP